MTQKEFTLKHEFKNVGKLKHFEDLDSPEEAHFGVKWKINIQQNGEHLAMYLYTNFNENQQVYADFTMTTFSKNKEKTHSVSLSNVYEGGEPPLLNWGLPSFMIWKTMEKEYLNRGNLEVEVHVKVTKMVGFHREELRSFGEDMKQFSDVTLVVDERKFYVSKTYRSYQAQYFANLFSGASQDSGKSEIELKNVNPEDLQYYLDILYGGKGIDETTVNGILVIAKMYNTPLVLQKCEEFWIEKSELELRKKLELAGKYGLEGLKKLCLDRIITKEDILSVLPENINKMDHESMAEILKKKLFLSFELLHFLNVYSYCSLST